MENREIAKKIYNHLNEKGAGLGDISIMLIESVLDKVLPQANVISCVCPNEIKTGTVAIHCCNLCGKPDEEWWGKH